MGYPDGFKGKEIRKQMKEYSVRNPKKCAGISPTGRESLILIFCRSVILMPYSIWYCRGETGSPVSIF